ncbi:hypothetical protein ACLOJK_000686 [Asimina triloba]
MARCLASHRRWPPSVHPAFLLLRTKNLHWKPISLLRGATNLSHLFQIHALVIKISLHQNRFILAKLLRCCFSLDTSPDTLSYARSIFDRIHSPDGFIWNTMIRAHLNAQDPEVSVSLFCHMRLQDGVVIDSFSLSLALQACGRSSNVRIGKRIHTHVLKRGFGADLFVLTAMVEMYAKFGDLEASRRIFDEMPHCDLFSRNVLLSEYVKIGNIRWARELFDQMPERDLVSWNTMIHGYATSGDLGTARELFDASCGRDLISWSSMITAYARSRRSNEALKLFQDMQLAGIAPDGVTMVGVLAACGDVGALGMGSMLHDYIERSGIEVDVKLGTSLVDMYAKCGDIENSLRIFNNMNVRDVLTWSAMIMGLAYHGYGEATLILFSRMILEGIEPNDITFVGMLSACNHAGLVSKGWTYFTSMKDQYGVSPKLEHYGCMVDLLGRAGCLQEARELIRNMPFVPDAVVWRALLGACRLHKNVKLAEEAITNLLELEPYSDGHYVLLSNVYAQGKQWDDVANARKMLRDNMIQKIPGSSSIEINNEVHEFVAGDNSHPRFEEIYAMLSEMTDQLNHAGFKPVTSMVLQDVDEQKPHLFEPEKNLVAGADHSINPKLSYA